MFVFDQKNSKSTSSMGFVCIFMGSKYDWNEYLNFFKKKFFLPFDRNFCHLSQLSNENFTKMKVNFWKIENFKNFHEFWSYQLQKFFGDRFYSKVIPQKFWSWQLHFFGKNSIFSKKFFLILSYTTFFSIFFQYFFFEKNAQKFFEVTNFKKKFFEKNFRVYVVHPQKALGISQILISLIQKEKGWRFWHSTVLLLNVRIIYFLLKIIISSY